MSYFIKERERSWFNVQFVVYVVLCFFSKVETNQKGVNHVKIRAKIVENTIKIKHEDSLLRPDDKFVLGFGFSFFHLQLLLISLAFFSWQTILHYTMRTIWNILFPLTIITAGTYNSLRPAILTVGTQTWAVGVLSLKALKQTTKIPKYSWYGLQMLFLAPLKLINIKRGKNKNKWQHDRPRTQRRNRMVFAKEEVANYQDDEDEDEQNDTDDEEAQLFNRTTTADGVVTSQLNLKNPFSKLIPVVEGNAVHAKTVEEEAVHANMLAKKQRQLPGRLHGCYVVFKRPTQISFVTVYRTIPLRLMSRVWGRLMQIRLPKPLRKPIIHIYATVYGCNLTEISLDDVSGYSCLGEFFRRRLRPEVRPIDSSSPLTSPADGKVVRSGSVQNARLEQIKGVSYSLSDFLGAITWKKPAFSTSAFTSASHGPTLISPVDESNNNSVDGWKKNAGDSHEEQKAIVVNLEKEEKPEMVAIEIPITSGSSESTSSLSPITSGSSRSTASASPISSGSPPPMSKHLTVDFDEEYQRELCVNDPLTHKLHHLVIYLAPGDYHRFHSPANWTVTFRRHFPGDLFSVAPLISRLISGLFNYNERVLYAGFWEHGFFSLTAVGATGVGSIRTSLDPDLSTNEYKWDPRKENHQDLDFTKDTPEGICVSKGEDFGEFNLGSTIVLVFEAPNNFRFQFNDADKVKVGQSVGVVDGSVGLDGRSVDLYGGSVGIVDGSGKVTVEELVNESIGVREPVGGSLAEAAIGSVGEAVGESVSEAVGGSVNEARSINEMIGA